MSRLTPAIGFLKKIGLAPVADGDLAGLSRQVEDKEVVDAVLKELQSYHKGKLVGFEQIKRLHLSAQPFDDSLVTPTFKLKRQLARNYFKDILDGLYALDLPVKSEVGKKRESKL